MQAFQKDNSSEIARLLTPYLTKIDIKDKYVRDAQQLLEGWDFTQEPDSAAAAYFNAVWRNTLKLAFGNKMPKEVRPDGQCLTVRPADETGPADENDKYIRECGERAGDTAQPDGGDRWYEVVRGILDDPENAWWKTEDRPNRPGDKNRDQLLAHAMKDARYELTSKLGKNIDNWSWGRLHQMFLTNQTLGTDGPGMLQGLFNRGPWNLGGGEAAVDATGWNAMRRLRGHLGPVDADGGQPRRPRQVPLDQSHRRLRARVRRALLRPDRQVGQGRPAALGVQREGREGRGQGHADAVAVGAGGGHAAAS